MASTAALASRLVGTWLSVFVSEEAEEDYFRFHEDLRYVKVFRWVSPNASQHYYHFRMWGELEAESVLRMKLSKERAGTLWELHFEEDTLVIQMTLKQQEGETEPERRRWNCRRLKDEEIPEWFEPEFNKAMARPWL